jgi:hypothetical protein
MRAREYSESQGAKRGGMAYGQDFAKSARRHLRAGDEMVAVQPRGAQPGCRAVAGYLFGLSGELAVKAMMWDSGMKRLEASSQKNDPYYAHFPKLRKLLMNQISGRRSRELKEIVGAPALFENWDVAMRYAPPADVKDSWVEAWQKDAKKLVAQMDQR